MRKSLVICQPGVGGVPPSQTLNPYLCWCGATDLYFMIQFDNSVHAVKRLVLQTAASAFTMQNADGCDVMQKTSRKIMLCSFNRISPVGY